MTENAQVKKRVERHTFASDGDGSDGLALGANRPDERTVEELERRLALVQEAAGVGIWEWLPDTDELWLSSAALSIFGASPHRPDNGIAFYAERAIEEDRESAKAHFQAALNSMADEYKDEFRIRHENGTLRWIECVGTILRNDKGSPTRVDGVIIDITDRRVAEEAYRSTEERLMLAQKAGGFGSWEWNALTKRIFLSDTLWKICGEKARLNWVKVESLEKYVFEDDTDQVRAHILAAFNSRTEEFKNEFRIRQRTGRVRWVETSGAIIRDDEGEPVRAYGTVSDVTEQKLISERVRDSEAELRLITNVIPALISCVDRDERYRFVNDQYSKFFGIDKPALVGRKLSSVLSPRSYKQLKPLIERAFAGETFSIDTWVTFKDRGERYVHVSYVPDLGPDRKVRGFYSFVTDLTDLRRSEDALKYSRERMRVLTESFTDYAIITTDTEGLIDSWNPGAEKIFGYREREILGRSGNILFTDEDNAKNIPFHEMAKARKEGRASDERWHLRKDGSSFFASGVLVPLYQNETLTGYAKIASDLTERIQYEADLHQARTDLEARVASRTQALAETNAVLLKEMEERAKTEEQRLTLLRKLFTIQEDERGRIARDLHDQLGQRLTALRLKIASISTLCEEHPDLAELVDRLAEIAATIDSEVSFLAWELRPSVLDETDFVTALGNYVKEWSRYSGIFADFNAIAVSGMKIHKDIETNLYRITQEALNNTAKYAQATKVDVILEGHEADLLLIVEDNGKGFDIRPEDALKQKKGFGLVGMRERASLINGSFDIESTNGKGTTVFVRVPLEG
ncbi:MAG: PAS/PAC sensor signal transduction histidine kinase [Acidobacteria bacterium OLB17]|nr:MAG: PAS/PAC sensor signal transduction histidine kinase [Acidobacteria bacterium OLB17]MCZ2390044.1 PAS domain S-box protein [Acidobacteriota bacterium]